MVMNCNCVGGRTSKLPTAIASAFLLALGVADLPSALSGAPVSAAPAQTKGGTMQSEFDSINKIEFKNEMKTQSASINKTGLCTDAKQMGGSS